MTNDSGAIKTTVPADLLEYGRSVLASQAFSRLLGAELIRWDADGVELRLSSRPDLMQQHGFFHGGTIAYLADNALTFAAAAALGERIVTAEMKINYLRPAIGEFVTARAWLVHAGRTQAVTRCDVSVVKGNELRICAAAQGTIARLAAEAPEETPPSKR
jgi:uncharacterized protein (TIGR00369 family)